MIKLKLMRGNEGGGREKIKIKRMVFGGRMGGPKIEKALVGIEMEILMQ